MDKPVIDHRGPEFVRLGIEVLEACQAVIQTTSPVIIYPSSGTGAWEAALANTLTPGDRVLMAETGHFASQWREVATRLGIEVELIPGDWRHGADVDAIGARLAEDRAHVLKAVLVVHNETSTGSTSRIPAVRQAMDKARHPALLMVDTISSLASIDYRHDEWGVDVAVGASQKGLMLPPGLGLVAVSEKSLAAAKSGGMRRSYWDWSEMLKFNARGVFPYTPATTLLYGLQEAAAMLLEEGLPAVFDRHRRLARATRAAVGGWGLDVLCCEPSEQSSVLTAVVMPPGHDADRFRRIVLDAYDMSLGQGLGRLTGKVFRIGHLGDINELTLLGALAGVEMGLAAAGVPHRAGGVAAAMASLAVPATVRKSAAFAALP